MSTNYIIVPLKGNLITSSKSFVLYVRSLLINDRNTVIIDTVLRSF